MTPNTFHIGLCMAGGVSAGAYTAGVVDYLLNALQRWEQQRGQPGVPNHRVQLSIIGGASAGGMTGLLTAAAVQQPNVNLFKQAWVTMQGNNMMAPLLDVTDLQKPELPQSLLNARLLDELANAAFLNAPKQWQPLPDYIHPQLKLFVTMTNIVGYPYPMSFNANLNQQHQTMSVHQDYACFQFSKNGQSEKGWMPLDLPSGLHVQTLRDAALATGAFPIGLPPRILHRPWEAIFQNQWIHQPGLVLEPSSTNYTSLHVDGGLMNNEPFEKVRELLNQVVQQENPLYALDQSFEQFRSSVLMIDPFPTEIGAPIPMQPDLLHMMQYLLQAILQQMKAKPAPIMQVLQQQHAGQFLIAPVRTILGGTAQRFEGATAMAGGALGGFSGFINQQFREHDYALGQYNCAMFLKNHFTIPKAALTTHPIFSNGYAEVNLNQFSSANGHAVQIIPLFAPNQVPLPWPVLHHDPLHKMQPVLQKRIGMLLKNIPMSGIKKCLFDFSAPLFLNRVIAKQVKQYLLQGLRAHGLLQLTD